MPDIQHPQRILVVDDEPDIRDLIRDILEDEGYRVEVASSAAEARQQKQRLKPDLVLLDIWMPEVDGVTLLKQWSEGGELDAPVVMMSGHGTVETAVEATRYGARDFVEKPLSTAKLLRTVQTALAESVPGPASQGPEALEMPVGHSRRMRELREQVRARAQMEKPLMLLADPGPEARIWANYYFSELPRPANARVVSGHLPASASAALFLPEVSELGMEEQWKLLERLRRAGQSGAGALVVASRYDPQQLRERTELLPELAEWFREALRLPSLQQRAEDIPELLEYYATFFSEHDKLPYRHFGVAAQNRLRNRSWPGGLEELKALVRRVLAAGGSEPVEPAELDALETVTEPVRPAAPADDGRLHLAIDLDWDLRQAREHFEREYLRRQLELCRNNVSELARKVGQERTNLYRKLKALGLQTRK
jgi:DNA-binding NtrC family response regulator